MVHAAKNIHIFSNTLNLRKLSGFNRLAIVSYLCFKGISVKYVKSKWIFSFFFFINHVKMWRISPLRLCNEKLNPRLYNHLDQKIFIKPCANEAWGWGGGRVILVSVCLSVHCTCVDMILFHACCVKWVHL